MKPIVAYFSASGVTAHAAHVLSQTLSCDLYEIQPEIPYTKADLNWMDKQARSTIEMKNTASRPSIKKLPLDLSNCDTILLGFPIWWYIAPTIINTFLEAHDFSEKTILLFATSGGSGFGKAVEHLKDSAPKAIIKEGKVFSSRAKDEEYIAWIQTL